MPELSKRVPFPELSLVRAGGTAEGPTSNTLLLYVDEAWDEETASALKRGLEACGRFDAGLALLVLFREGSLARAGSRLMRNIEQFARELGLPVLINEDVRGGWSRSFSFRTGAGAPAWALISPEGAVTWKHQGHVSPERLTEALDNHLHRSPDVTPVEFRKKFDIGSRFSAAVLNPSWSELYEAPCPPAPLGRLRGQEVVVTFVQKDSSSSHSQLRFLTAKYEQREDEPGPAVVVVVDGADEREAEALKNQLGFDFATLPDPNGTITDRFGVMIWPTTITLDHAGTISAIETGVAAEPDDEVGPTKAAE
jgi:peroxiredoxin